MLKIPKKSSVIISLVLTGVFFAGCIVSAFCTHSFVAWLCKVYAVMFSVSGNEMILFEILSYAVIAIATAISLLIFFLLIRVYHGEVFTAKSVSLIRGVSWCCFLLAATFSVLTYFFTIAASMLAFVAILLGLCLRVVKNVIEEATEIKAENDLTV